MLMFAPLPPPPPPPPSSLPPPPSAVVPPPAMPMRMSAPPSGIPGTATRGTTGITAGATPPGVNAPMPPPSAAYSPLPQFYPMTQVTAMQQQYQHPHPQLPQNLPYMQQSPPVASGGTSSVAQNGTTVPLGNGTPSLATTTASPSAGGVRQVCQYFAVGTCRYDQRCKNRHITPNGFEIPTYPDPEPTSSAATQDNANSWIMGGRGGMMMAIDPSVSQQSLTTSMAYPEQQMGYLNNMGDVDSSQVTDGYLS